MIDVVKASFYIKADAFNRKDFERYSTELFDEWDKYVEARINLPDYSLSLVIEEGSIKGSGKIAATLGAFYFAIATYGSFISAVKIIRDQADYVTSALFDQAKQSFGCSNTQGNTRHTSGEIYYLKDLFERVQRGSITPDQAVNEVTTHLGDEGASSPEFMKDLALSLAKAPLHPEQLSLSDESWENCLGFDALEREPRPSIPQAPQVPIPQHFRIEISRLSKGKEKKIKLTKVK